MMGMPLQFEANHGQVDAPVKFLARGKGYTLFLTPTESVMALQQRESTAENEARQVNDLTALPKQAQTIDGSEQLPGVVNFFSGSSLCPSC
jgi:hypothetical protein